MDGIRIDVVGVVKDDPDLQILVERQPDGAFLIYQWRADDGPYDGWVLNEDHLKQYFEEAGWEIVWHPELEMPTQWKSGPGSWGKRIRPGTE